MSSSSKIFGLAFAPYTASSIILKILNYSRPFITVSFITL